MRALRWTALLLLGACATPPGERLEGIGRFEARLADEYEKRRASEFEERDFRDARQFRRKRDAAASGERPLPDDLARRTYAPAVRAELEAARQRLLDVLGTNAPLSAPEATADAQSAFDCWAQEAEEDAQPDEIAECRATFEDRVAEAERAAQATLVILLPSDEPSAIVVSDETTAVEIDQPFSGVGAAGGTLDDGPADLGEEAVTRALARSLMAEPAAERSYLIYFETGGSGIEDITEESRERFEAALADAAATTAAQVTVYGHSDRVGRAEFNVRLSLLRAEEIRRALIAAGANEDAIDARSFGESDPLVPTPDGVAEPRNRRVEIAVR